MLLQQNRREYQSRHTMLQSLHRKPAWMLNSSLSVCYMEPQDPKPTPPGDPEAGGRGPKAVRCSLHWQGHHWSLLGSTRGLDTSRATCCCSCYVHGDDNDEDDEHVRDHHGDHYQICRRTIVGLRPGFQTCRSCIVSLKSERRGWLAV